MQQHLASEAGCLLPLASGAAPAVQLPQGRETPFGWPALRVDAAGINLRWVQLPERVTAFRFSIAIDLREAPVVELVLAQSGYRIGLCEVGYGYPLQTFEIPLFAGVGQAILREGVILRTVGNASVFWILHRDGDDSPVPPALALHLFATGLPQTDGASPQAGGIACSRVAGESERNAHGVPAPQWQQSFDSLCSTRSLQVFGWLEGCVLEGLYELGRRVPQWQTRADAAADAHLEHFFAGGRMEYVSPRSERVVDRWYNNEHGLMVPTLIRRMPEHPAIEGFRTHWTDYLWAQTRQLERNLSCEACYTLAYPMALLSQRYDDGGERLELALALLALHRRYLKEKETLYLHYSYQDGKRIYPEWLRGVAWYLLGHARVLEIARECGCAPQKLAPVEHELSATVARMMPLQNERGLWSCFALELQTGDETSGSAGVATAFLLAAQLGCADSSAVAAARRTLDGLVPHLTPDGLLGGVSQSNKAEAGESLQRYGYRCLSQMGQGLAVQLAAVASSF